MVLSVLLRASNDLTLSVCYPLIALNVTKTKPSHVFSGLKMDTIIAVFCSTLTVCSQLCTNSSAGEGRGGTVGGAFMVSTWDGAGLGV